MVLLFQDTGRLKKITCTKRHKVIMWLNHVSCALAHTMSFGCAPERQSYALMPDSREPVPALKTRAV